MNLTALSILIADDNEMNRWLLAEQMHYWSEDISLARDGQEAWELLQKKRYSLVFIDVNMPVMNGYELIRKIKSELTEPVVPMIAVTAHVQSQDRHLLIAEGFNDCLIKPIVLADLQRVVAKWCMPFVVDNSDYYADKLLEKVEHNRELGRIFLQKLFAETPDQLASLERALQNQQIRPAWEIAHKLHGTFCFYGFADFRTLAKRLEQLLLEADLATAMRQFKKLAAKFSDLQNMQTSLLQRLNTEMERATDLGFRQK